MIKTKKIHDYFYFAWEGKFLICDLNNCAESDRTIDLYFDELANNKKLLDVLSLLHMEDSDASDTRWFASYLSSFSSDDEKHDRYDKLLHNPKVRVLLQDETIRKEALIAIQNPAS